MKNGVSGSQLGNSSYESGSGTKSARNQVSMDRGSWEHNAADGAWS